MPNVCVFGQCSNKADQEKGITLFAFPNDEKLRKKWTKCVLQSRKDFAEPPIGANHITVCSRHFNPDTLVKHVPTTPRRKSSKTTRCVTQIIVSSYQCNALSPWRNYSHSALWRIQSVTWSDLMDHQKSFTWLVMQPTNKWKLHYMYIRKDTLRPFLGMAETSVIVNLATLLIIVLLSYSKTEK